MHSQLCLLIPYIDGIKYVTENFYLASYINNIKNSKSELLNSNSSWSGSYTKSFRISDFVSHLKGL